MEGYAQVKYYASNTYGGSIEYRSLSVERDWVGDIVVKLYGSSQLESVEIHLPEQFATALYQAIKIVSEGQADRVEKRRFEQVDED